MPKLTHPEQALFDGLAPPPVLAACEHFAGKQKLMEKALLIQQEMGPVFDITCDCEDGAPTGKEREHAQMIAGLLNGPLNRFKMAGVRIHDYSHPNWRSDVDILVGTSGHLLSHITIPKPTSAKQVAAMIDYIRHVSERRDIERPIPIHILIETQGGLREIWDIASIDAVKVIDFGLMDFISDHHGTIPARCMRSPGQFEHRLLIRAKSEIVAAALANDCVPSHNVTLELRDSRTVYNDALSARYDYGFLRMWSIHPMQIQPIINAMKPDLTDVHNAAAILLSAQLVEWAPIQYEGELHDRASYRYYWQLLKRAHATGISLPQQAHQAFFASISQP